MTAATSGDVAHDRTQRPKPISVIVPTRNAAAWIVDCLTSIRACEPAEIILVDGHSDDGTVLLAEGLVDRVLRDDGEGPGAARNLGVAVARSAWIAFVDADIVLPRNALGDLLQEARRRNLVGLQAALHSSGTDYWSEQLAWHHNNGRSRSWFGVSATLLRREIALAHPFDPSLTSGEDVDLRLRLASSRVPVGVSSTVTAAHRFASGAEASRAQWAADGAGLGRLVRKHGSAAVRHLAVPFAAGIYWILRSVRTPRRLPYFAGFVAGNWRSAIAGLQDTQVAYGSPDARASTVAAIGLLWLGAAVLALLGFALIVIVALLIPAIPRFILEAVWLPVVAGVAVACLVWLEFTATLPEDHRWRLATRRYRTRILLLVAVIMVVTALRLGANLRLLD